VLLENFINDIDKNAMLNYDINYERNGVHMNNKNYPLYPITEITNLKQLIYFDHARTNNNVAFMYAKDKKTTIEITYSQLIQDIEAFGTYLFENGYRNTHIAVVGENSYEWILTYFSTVLGGNVIVPVDKELSADEIENILVSSDSTVLVYSDMYSDIAKELMKKNLTMSYINMKDIPTILDKGKTLIVDGMTTFADYQINDEDLAAIVYTSGTTGVSKGVMLTHKNIAANSVACCKNVYAEGSTVCVLPLHHTFAFTLGVCAILLYRQPIYISRSLKNIMSDFQRAKPAYTFMVPMMIETMYKKVWATAKEQGKDKLLRVMIKISNGLLKIGIDLRRVLFKSVLSAFGGNLDWISCGGAAIDLKYIKGFRDFGVNVINGYGITECSPIVSSNRPKYWVDGSVGVVVYGCEVKIDNPNADGEGEILVKGLSVMKGYYKNEESTRQAFSGEWFKTGDIGKYENEVLYITGRAKNVIILSNGKNVYPEELELLLSEIEGIAECMVYEENNLITVEIYADKPNSKSEEELITERINVLNRSSPLYKQIMQIKFRETEFPKTTTKKIKRR